MPQILGRDVGPIGYGLMGLTFPKAQDEEKCFGAMRAALAAGCNFWNAGEFYGARDANSLVLLEKYFAKYPEDADKVVLSVKGCLSLQWQPDLEPDAVRRSVDDCIKQLKGRKKIDIFEPARLDHSTPIEQWLDVLQKEYIEKGKIGGIGLSEVSAQTIRKVASMAKVAAVEVEVGLWTTDILDNGIADVCSELSIPIAGYSPLGRGMLTGQIKSLDDIPKDDFRRNYPKFSAENFPTNLKLVDAVKEVAQKKNCTPAQIAIAWVAHLQQVKRGLVCIPIPGASSEARAKENSTLVDLGEADLKEIDSVLQKFKVVGGRYPEAQSSHLNV